MSQYRVCPFPNCAELNDRDDEWCQVCGRCLVPPGMETSSPNRGEQGSAASASRSVLNGGGMGFPSESALRERERDTSVAARPGGVGSTPTFSRSRNVARLDDRPQSPALPSPLDRVVMHGVSTTPGAGTIIEAGNSAGAAGRPFFSSPGAKGSRRHTFSPLTGVSVTAPAARLDPTSMTRPACLPGHRAGRVWR